MTGRTDKVEALASHLLDGFLLLRNKYSILEPMLFDPKVVGARGSGKAAHGFSQLKHALFLSCAQDIANLSSDRDRRAPSIFNIVSGLDDSPIRNELREKFAVWALPEPNTYSDPLIVEALMRMEHREVNRPVFPGGSIT